MFKGRDLLIASMHEKEKVIGPILEKELGVKSLVAINLNTDALGTFTGEFDRKDDPITTARKKCLLAMEIYNCDLAIASEGSFGAHPQMFFAHADEEFLLFMDKKNNLEIIEREISTETNFNGSEINTINELLEFAKQTNFPSHALIIKKSKDDFSKIVKGITTSEQLTNTFHRFISNYGTVYVETDMRAMYNPTRMKVIETATKKLAKKINSLCPNCSTPGFGITEAISGLPCKQCRFPTRSTLSYIYSCKKCDFKKTEEFPKEKKVEDPLYCDFCNP